MDDTEPERKRLLKRSDRLSDFGTITSLASTALYFAEQLLVKKIPRWLTTISLTGVGAGIAAIFISMRDKIKAENLEVSELKKEISQSEPARNDCPAGRNAPAWTERNIPAAGSSRDRNR